MKFYRFIIMLLAVLALSVFGDASAQSVPGKAKQEAKTKVSDEERSRLMLKSYAHILELSLPGDSTGGILTTIWTSSAKDVFVSVKAKAQEAFDELGLTKDERAKLSAEDISRLENLRSAAKVAETDLKAAAMLSDKEQGEKQAGKAWDRLLDAASKVKDRMENTEKRKLDGTSFKRFVLSE